MDPTSDVSSPSEFMPRDVQLISDEGARNMRDWFVFRDAANGLEFLVDLLTRLTTT